MSITALAAVATVIRPAMGGSPLRTGLAAADEVVDRIWEVGHLLAACRPLHRDHFLIQVGTATAGPAVARWAAA